MKLRSGFTLRAHMRSAICSLSQELAGQSVPRWLSPDKGGMVARSWISGVGEPAAWIGQLK